jgi:hypothetical protein
MTPWKQAQGFKMYGVEDTGNATQVKNAGRGSRQEIARHTQNRESTYFTRRHKSIPRRLPVSPTVERTGGRRHV